MGIGGISGISVGYPSYIYNTNRVSAKSMDKVQAISDDALASSVGYDSGKNENPLKIGETKDFMSILGSQMAMSQANAARIMQQPAPEQQKPVEEMVANEPDKSQDVDSITAAQLQGIVA